VEALLLSASADRLRVAIPGRGDTVEFQMIEGRWYSERGEQVEVGALIAADGMSVERFVPQAQVRTLSAS
jgi:hypothetical protein